VTFIELSSFIFSIEGKRLQFPSEWWYLLQEAVILILLSSQYIRIIFKIRSLFIEKALFPIYKDQLVNAII
jgi:hypothetical protein